MKNRIFLFNVVLLFFHLNYWVGSGLAQNVGIGTLVPHPSALLDIDAGLTNDKGLLVRKVVTEKPAPGETYTSTYSYEYTFY